MRQTDVIDRTFVFVSTAKTKPVILYLRAMIAQERIFCTLTYCMEQFS